MPEDNIRPDRPRRRDGGFQEDRPRRQRPRDDYDDDDDDRRVRRDGGALEGLIPYKNPLALTGYYVGVFSLIPCAGLLLGPAAIVLGVLGLKHRNKQPRAGGKGHAITAIVLGVITSLVWWGLVALGVGAAIFAK